MKKKIIVTSAQVPFVKGGAELMVSMLVKNLCDRGYDTELVNIPYKWYPEESLYDNMLAWRLLDLSESNGQKIDLVIGTKFPSYGVRHENKVCWLMHQYRQAYDLFDTPVGLGCTPTGARIRQNVEKYDYSTLTDSKKIYTISENVSSRLKKYNQIDSDPLYHPPSLVGRYKSGEFGDYIVSVGRIDKLKRNDLLIEALAYCDKGVKAKIAGRGPEMENLKALAEKCGVADRVEFLGFVNDDDLLDLYAGAFAVFFAPVDEDYGYITLEAFLSQKPLVTCSDTGGVLEFAENSRSAFVTAPSPKELGNSINRMYANKQLCKKMGLEGYEKVKDISWDNVIDKLTETLR